MTKSPIAVKSLLSVSKTDSNRHDSSHKQALSGYRHICRPHTHKHTQPSASGGNVWPTHAGLAGCREWQEEACESLPLDPLQRGDVSGVSRRRMTGILTGRVSKHPHADSQFITQMKNTHPTQDSTYRKTAVWLHLSGERLSASEHLSHHIHLQALNHSIIAPYERTWSGIPAGIRYSDSGRTAVIRKMIILIYPRSLTASPADSQPSRGNVLISPRLLDQYDKRFNRQVDGW